MNKCEECTIGIIYDDFTDIITLSSLKNEIEHYNNNIEMYKKLDKMYGYETERKPRTLKDYADRRKNLGLKHFNYCPFCGAKINWEEIKEGNYER